LEWKPELVVVVGHGDVGAGRVVVTAAHVVVDDRRRDWGVFILDGDAIEAVAEDRQHAASRRRVDLQRPRARGLDPFGRVDLDVADQRQTRAVALLRVRSIGDDPLDDLARVDAELGRPGDHPLRRPRAVLPMRLRPMRLVGDVGPLASVAATMAGDPSTIEQ
jgi:hypothetical protein